MADIKPNPISTRTRIALEYLKAVEQRDKSTLDRVLSDEHYEYITVPLQKPDQKPRRKEQVLTRAESQDILELKSTPLDVTETVDGRVIMHVRWRSLRKDGHWVQIEEVRFISFVNGPGPFDDPQIGHVKVFVDWVGRSQWISPQGAARSSLGAMYNEIMGLQPLTPPQGGGKCNIM